MYWYLKNLHNKTISQNNLDKILQKKVQQNLAEYGKIKIPFVVISYFVFCEIKKSYFVTTPATRLSVIILYFSSVVL
jgi:hypothetical protein